MNKPTLVITCAAAKLETPSAAFDLYLGSMYKQIRKHCGGKHVSEFFNVIILSAEHGLIPAEKVIAPYEKRMAKRSTKAGRKEITTFALTHQENAIKLVESLNSSDIYVLLSYDYLEAFKLLVPDAVLKAKFKNITISEDHKGIGELKGKLKNVLSKYVTM